MLRFIVRLAWLDLAFAGVMLAFGGQRDANAHPWVRSGGYDCYRPRA